MNYDFYEDSFEVYNIFLGKKTDNLDLGQTMSFSDLTGVPNFS